MEAVRYYAENCSMKDSIYVIGINTRFIAIVNYYFSVHSYEPYRYIDKLNSDMCSYVTFILNRFWMSTFSHDASGKYCICEATVDGAQYCETRQLQTA